MSFANIVLSFVMFVLGTAAVLGVMALVAWITGLMEGLESGRTAAAPAIPVPAPVPASQAAAAPPASAPAAAARTPVTAPPVGGGIEPNIVAVITAAVTTALQGRPFRIQSIQPAEGPMVISTSWTQAGRQYLHASHVIERKFR